MENENRIGQVFFLSVQAIYFPSTNIFQCLQCFFYAPPNLLGRLIYYYLLTVKFLLKSCCTRTLLGTKHSLHYLYFLSRCDSFIMASSVFLFNGLSSQSNCYHDRNSSKRVTNLNLTTNDYVTPDGLLKK